MCFDVSQDEGGDEASLHTADAPAHLPCDTDPGRRCHAGNGRCRGVGSFRDPAESVFSCSHIHNITGIHLSTSNFKDLYESPRR